MLDVFLIATIVALILLAAVGLYRIVCHVIKRKQDQTKIKRSIAILGETSTDLAEGMIELLERVEALENKTLDELVPLVNDWFQDRNLAFGDGLGQLQKLHEEVYELAEARIVNDFSAEVDAIGDITVVLIGYCLQRGLTLEQCLESAYNEIKDRTGKLVNGVFVKDN